MSKKTTTTRRQAIALAAIAVAVAIVLIVSGGCSSKRLSRNSVRERNHTQNVAIEPPASIDIGVSLDKLLEESSSLRIVYNVYAAGDDCYPNYEHIYAVEIAGTETGAVVKERRMTYDTLAIDMNEWHDLIRSAYRGMSDRGCSGNKTYFIKISQNEKIIVDDRGFDCSLGLEYVISRTRNKRAEDRRRLTPSGNPDLDELIRELEELGE